MTSVSFKLLNIKISALCRIRYSVDESVACFQYKWEAEQFHEQLKKKMGHFGLELQEDKSRLIKFGRFARQDAKEEVKSRNI